MYLLYLDDSGSPKNIKENHFVLGGFIIPENKLYWINNNLDQMASKIQPNAPDAVEFHASAIAGGRIPPWDKITIKEERHEILKKVLMTTVNDKNDINILACAVEKKYFPGQDVVELAFEDICSRFQRFLQRRHASNIQHTKTHTNGWIILDESSYETTLQELAKNFRKIGTKWAIKLNNIQEVPMFVNSRASRCIQLADHIAYAIFRRYEHADLAYYNIIEGYFDEDDGKIHGICHKTSNQSCTCTHCAQKKIQPKS